MRDPTLREGCRNARTLARLCELLEGELGAETVRGTVISAELGEELLAQAAGMSYQELEQFDTQSSYYDPDVGPYYWED